MNTTLWLTIETRKEFDKYKKQLSNIMNVNLNSDKTLELLMLGFDEKTFSTRYVKRMSKKN